MGLWRGVRGGQEMRGLPHEGFLGSVCPCLGCDGPRISNCYSEGCCDLLLELELEGVLR